jgi:hypothetical protein
VITAIGLYIANEGSFLAPVTCDEKRTCLIQLDVQNRSAQSRFVLLGHSLISFEIEMGLR